MAKFEPFYRPDEKHVYDEWHVAPAVKVGPFVFCSGALGLRADGSVVEDPAEQFTTAFENLRGLLSEAGAGLEDVFELLTFHIGLAEHIELFGQVKDGFITEPYPTWTAIEVAGLGGGYMPGLFVEIKATAHVG
jgi:enamine deaminase RidA (YjgF/YER057c/UK114 family)